MSSRRGDGQLDADITARIRELGTAASALLDRPIRTLESAGVGPAKCLLADVWDGVVAEISRRAYGDAPPTRIVELTGLLARVRELESRVDDVRLAASAELMRRVRRALGRLDGATGADELLTQAAEQVCTIGFDRASISTVEDTTWQMHSMCIDKDPRLAEEMVAATHENPPRLDVSLVEGEVVTRSRPGLVLDVQNNPRVDRRLVAISGCTSYGVAPLRANGKVVGLVHADSHYPRRDLDQTDLAVLNLYAEGVGQTLARVSVQEGLASLCAGIAHLAGDLTLKPRPAAAPELPSPTPSSTPSSILSSRELEVIELMAAGDTNLAIARKLSISEGTVKTHITHILRKLDASNRAEAVAYWLRR